MKEVSLTAILRRNPAVKRDMKTVEEAQAAIKKRRKAGFTGKGYELEPAIGGSKRGLRQDRPKLGTLKLTFHT